MAVEQALDFTIKVLDGALKNRDFGGEVGLIGAVPRGTIRLRGRALPYQGVSWGGIQRVKHTWYPGNPEASEQLLGPEEEPTTIKGMWKDLFLGDGAARHLIAVFDELRIKGVPIEVTWGQGFVFSAGATVLTGDPFIRRGVISRTLFTPPRPQDAAYEIEFRWRSRGGGESVPPIAIEDPRPALGADALLAVVADNKSWAQSFAGVLDTIGGGFNQLFELSLGQFTDALDSVSEDIQAVDKSVTDLAAIPQAQARKLIGALDLFLESAFDFRQALFDLPLAFQLPIDDALSLLRFRDLIFDQERVLDIAQDNIRQERERVAAFSEPDFITEIRLLPGTDLRDASTQVYGYPDEWFTIADYNGFDGSVVPETPDGPSDNPGRAVRFPRLTGQPTRLAC